MLEVTLIQFEGRCKGRPKSLDFDRVYVCKGLKTSHVGFLPHKENATLRFTRFLPEDLKAEIHKACREIRKADGRPPIADFTTAPPDPRLIRAALKGQRRGKKKTTSQIILPEGMKSE